VNSGLPRLVLIRSRLWVDSRVVEARSKIFQGNQWCSADFRLRGGGPSSHSCNRVWQHGHHGLSRRLIRAAAAKRRAGARLAISL
jgi:hypothetical protein